MSRYIDFGNMNQAWGATRAPDILIPLGGKSGAPFPVAQVALKPGTSIRVH
ncbi:MAG: hypothetical protein JXB35_07640 [Anaerolineae bacterium]|nr:hypothetical protein [Anaerolineae bacterium]